MKTLLITAAALTMTAGVATANPDKWDMRGADQVNSEVQMTSASFVGETESFGTGVTLDTAPLLETEEAFVTKPHENRAFNR